MQTYEQMIEAEQYEAEQQAREDALTDRICAQVDNDYCSSPDSPRADKFVAISENCDHEACWYGRFDTEGEAWDFLKKAGLDGAIVTEVAAWESDSTDKEDS